MTSKKALSTSAVLLLILGLLHTARLVDSFSSSLPQSKSVSSSQQQSIIQSPRVGSCSALRVATGLAEETSGISGSGGGAQDDNSGLPEFGQDGLYHITNEAEYK